MFFVPGLRASNYGPRKEMEPRNKNRSESEPMFFVHPITGAGKEWNCGTIQQVSIQYCTLLKNEPSIALIKKTWCVREISKRDNKSKYLTLCMINHDRI